MSDGQSHSGLNLQYLTSCFAIYKYAQILCGILVSSLASTNLCISYNATDPPTINVTSAPLVHECKSYSNGEIHARGQGFVIFVAVIGIFFTASLLASAVFNLLERFSNIPWMFCQFIGCSVFALLYLIVASVETWYANGYNLEKSKHVDSYSKWAAAAVFSWFALLLYLSNGVVIFLRNSAPGRGIDSF